MPDSMHCIRIHASAERVYHALTTTEGIRNWWTRDAQLDSRIGGIGEFRFYQGEGTTTVRVDQLEPTARVSWTTISANAPGVGTAPRLRSSCDPSRAIPGRAKRS
jgi:uncharacterized protein YndB with AHSA1/START domain